MNWIIATDLFVVLRTKPYLVKGSKCLTWQVSRDSLMGKLMHLTVRPPHGPGLIPGNGGVIQWIFPRLITCASLYTVHSTVQGEPKRRVAPPEANASNLWRSMMPTDQSGLWRTKTRQFHGKISLSHTGMYMTFWWRWWNSLMTCRILVKKI